MSTAISAAMGGPLLEARGLVKAYGGRVVVRLDRLALGPGEAIALTGPNGSGKSTLLRLLAFLERPDAGWVRLAGAPAHPRREVTLLLQEPYLLRASARANVLLGLRFRGLREEGERTYENVMREVGFARPDDYASRLPWQLSGGEKQRIALAARLILAPRVLLLDEPTANVDAASGKAILTALEKVRAAGAGLVCATHDRALIGALAAHEVRL